MSEHLNAETFEDYVQQSELPVLADFYRDGCVPCRRIAPLLSKAETEYAGRLAVVRVNVVQNPSLPEQYQIQAAPTLLLFEKGEEKARHRGVIDRNGLKEWIKSVISEGE